MKITSQYTSQFLFSVVQCRRGVDMKGIIFLCLLAWPAISQVILPTIPPTVAPTVPVLCLAGFYLDAVLNVCNICANGTTSMGLSSTSCTPCLIGNECLNGLESPCSAGTYQPLTGQSSCLTCTSGSYCPTASITQNNCTAGYSCLNPSEEIICNYGTYSSSGSTACINCPMGSYANSTGSLECFPCEENFYSSNEGMSECIACESNYHSFQGASSCIINTTPFPTQKVVTIFSVQDEGGIIGKVMPINSSRRNNFNVILFIFASLFYIILYLS